MWPAQKGVISTGIGKPGPRPPALESFDSSTDGHSDGQGEGQDDGGGGDGDGQGQGQGGIT